MGKLRRGLRSWSGWLDMAVMIGTLSVLAFVLAANDRSVVVYWTKALENRGMFLSQFLSQDEEIDFENRGRQGPPPIQRRILSVRSVEFQAVRFQSDLTVSLAILSIGFTIMNLRRSPSRRRLWIRPGAAACLVAAITVVLWVGKQSLMSLRMEPGSLWGTPADPFHNQWPLVEQNTGLAVLGTWAVLAFGRHWHPRRSWDDRIGRLIGLLWLWQLVFRLLTPALMPLSNYRM